jgi:hypothetical protein
MSLRHGKRKSQSAESLRDKFSSGSTARSPKEDVMKINSFATSSLVVLLGLIAPIHSFAEEPYCIAVGGGFGHGGTTFVARNFSLPGEGKCTPWAGYTKTASTVILTTTGTSCLSSDGKALTVSVSSADPSYVAQPVADYIALSRGDSKEPFTGEDTGEFALPGSSETVTCTSELLNLPSSHP